MTTKYTFKQEAFYEDGTVADVITHRHEGEDIGWPELLEAFVCFLRGCGYVMPEGDVEFVEDESSDLGIEP